MESTPYIRWFADTRIEDISLVGGKNASLGEMYSQLSLLGVCVPNGFCITAQAYWDYLEYNNLEQEIKDALLKMDQEYSQLGDISALKKGGARIRAAILKGEMPPAVAKDIEHAYKTLSDFYGVGAVDVAVRSSATAEDLPNASFAGQQESFLNVVSKDALIDACIHCLASLFTDRAIAYRKEHGFDHFKVALSIGVQKMIRSDLASSGVCFTLDPETGHSQVVVIEASYGLGESIVLGKVTPDNFMVHKPTFKDGFHAVLKKRLGDKKTKMVYGKTSVESVSLSLQEQQQYALSDDEVCTIAQLSMIIEDYYSKKAKKWVPMDIEWAKDGNDEKIYIIQARPETVHSHATHARQIYMLKPDQEWSQKKALLLQGIAIGEHIVTGTVRVIDSPKQLDQVQQGDIVVTDMTDPDWVPVMKRAAAIITNRGGRTCHAAIVSRELGIPALVGTKDATAVLKNNQEITLDCSCGSTGFIYQGHIPYTIQDVSLSLEKKYPTSLLLNIAQSDAALAQSLLPVDGVGLARTEFIIAHDIGIHPLALINQERIKDHKVLEYIEEKTALYQHKESFFVDQLAQGVGLIAAAFYPRPVVVRFSDFKTNEYKNLLGGSFFEEEEENPMLGYRGALRYYHGSYKQAFALECQAMQRVRDHMGLRNLILMIPFVRTLKEAELVVQELEKNGLVRGKNGLKLYMMCEIPSNVLLIDQFAQYFDGFSIGSNDLTQLVLGVDRDSAMLSTLFTEQDQAVKLMIKQAIDGAKRTHSHISICGQAPSDYPDFAQFLIEAGINAISLNADAVIRFMTQD